MSHTLRPVPVAVSLLLTSVLAACGGGGSGEPQPSTPNTLTLSGVVQGNGAIKNAVVCLDLNANSLCDADEPASLKTGADGAYSITVDTSKVTQAQISNASLIAPQVPGKLEDGKATVDMADAGAVNTQRGYVLRQVAGKAGQINPLTTLVAAGVMAGMTEAVARDNVVLQLGLASANKIDDYQTDPSVGATVLSDSARMAAQVVSAALEAGASIVVGDQLAADLAEQGDLRGLTYSSTSDFRYQDFLRESKAVGTAGRKLTDHRVGKAAGTALTSNTLFNQAYLTPQGWLRCDATVPITTTLGNPVRSVFCNARVNFAYGLLSDISGTSMAELVTQQASQVGNVFNAGVDNTPLVNALGTARFPAGSSMNAATSVMATRPIFINNLSTDGRPQSEATTLEQLIASKPATGVNLSNSSGSLSLGISTGPLKNLRVAFTGTKDASNGTVQYYECDLNAAQTVASNCVATQTGTYAIETVHGVRVMRFAGHTETTMTNTRLYVEVKASQQANAVTTGDWVYAAREVKSGVNAESISVSNRLTSVGWQAMKNQLGI